MQAVTLKNLSMIRSGGKVILDNISFNVEQGDFFSLVGANGAGKSTIIGIMTSLLPKTAGTVKIFGYDLETELTQAKTCMGVVPQEINFNIFEKVMDVLVYQAGYYGIPVKMARERAEYYLKKLDLWDKRNQITKNLSGGMKRGLMIVRALVNLVHEPKLLILDEPTAGIDVERRDSTWDFLRSLNQQGTTIILTTHYLEEAEKLCRNIVVLDQGKIVENTSMARLLNRLDTETLICDVRNTIYELPTENPFQIQRVDAQQIEVKLKKEQSLNQLIDHLSKLGIEIMHIRNKTSRLETLFLQLTHPHSS